MMMIILFMSQKQNKNHSKPHMQQNPNWKKEQMLLSGTTTKCVFTSTHDCWFYSIRTPMRIHSFQKCSKSCGMWAGHGCPWDYVVLYSTSIKRKTCRWWQRAPCCHYIHSRCSYIWLKIHTKTYHDFLSWEMVKKTWQQTVYITLNPHMYNIYMRLQKEISITNTVKRYNNNDKKLCAHHNLTL